MREERSPSFFNPQEVSIVLQYVENLMMCKNRGINLKQRDIGVISPYRKQVGCFVKVLSSIGFSVVIYIYIILAG